MIIRTWQCLNRHCLNAWDDDGDHPPCPRCHGIRVKWVPKPVALRSERTKEIDRTVSQLTTTYGDQNYRSPRRHEAVAPKRNPTPVTGKTRRFEPMTGWAVDLPLDAAGNPAAICAPTGVTAKLPVKGLEQRVPESRKIGVGPKVEASWRPPNGIPK